MQTVPGHPYVVTQAQTTPYGDTEIVCHCRLCGDVWRHRCQYPPKAPVWVARYCAQHAHGNPAVRQQFAQRYHMGLQALRRM